MRLAIRRSLSATGSPKMTPVVFTPGQPICGACQANHTFPMSAEHPETHCEPEGIARSEQSVK